jgi:hypothetical protein
MLNTKMPMTTTTAAFAGLPDSSACPIVELRQYTLHPGRRDAFVAMFEREFIETQECVGNRVIGQYRDLDEPDRFVWLRGFADMPARAEALNAFYGGPVWKAHRDQANAHFIDTDNVLLLRAVAPAGGFALGGLKRAAPGADLDAAGLLVATIYTLDGPAHDGFIAYFRAEVAPELARAGIVLVGTFATETSANNFPRLPVREGEHVFVWFALYASLGEYRQRSAAVARSVTADIETCLKSPSQVLRLLPTPRSLLHA